MSVDEDARAFGQHFQGGWRLGLLVARNVHKKAGAGRPSKSEPVRNKVSCTKFARMAGVSERTVQLYYNAWTLAAEEGHCTPAERLSPGEEDPLLPIAVSDEHHEMWRKFYRQVRERRTDSAKARTGSERKQEDASGETSDAPKAEAPSNNTKSDGGRAQRADPKDHPLYPLLQDINQLGDALKRRDSAALVRVAAEKVTAARYKAGLRRVTGVL